ncbi:MAG: AraC family transcriptional regulator [Bacteroidales bacterium]|nr:AraC family transcriptional regulator [Bacteroidales bacterium]
MTIQLNISNIIPFAEINSHIAVHGNFAIIRSIVGLKEQMSREVGSLLFIPLGRILMVTKGDANLRLNMQPCRVERGDVLVIPENYYMEVQGFSTDYNSQIVTYSGMATPFKRWTKVSLDETDSQRIGSYFDLLWQVVKSQSCQPATLDNLLSAMLSDIYSISLHEVSTRPHEVPTAAMKIVARFFDLLAESDGAMRNVSAYADCLCITPNHLSAIIKQQTGKTVLQLLNAHAVLQAKVLLLHSEQSIADISDQLGFENPPSFTRFFKRETALTPREFRKGRQK